MRVERPKVTDHFVSSISNKQYFYCLVSELLGHWRIHPHVGLTSPKKYQSSETRTIRGSVHFYIVYWPPYRQKTKKSPRRRTLMTSTTVLGRLKKSKIWNYSTNQFLWYCSFCLPIRQKQQEIKDAKYSISYQYLSQRAWFWNSYDTHQTEWNSLKYRTCQITLGVSCFEMRPFWKTVLAYF